MSVNKVMVLGRLGQDPELKYTPSGNAVCNFSVATSEVWTDKDGTKKEKTEWHRVVTWGKTAELCNQYLSKGKQCFLEGKLQTRNWDNKEGQKQYTTEIVANSVQFLSTKDASQTNQNQQSDGTVGQYIAPDNKDYSASDIPF